MLHVNRSAPAREVDKAANITGGPMVQMPSKVFSLLVPASDSLYAWAMWTMKAQDRPTRIANQMASKKPKVHPMATAVLATVTRMQKMDTTE